MLDLFRDYQGHNDGISAHWDFSGDPCPIVKYQWSVHRMDGLEVLPVSDLLPGNRWFLNVLSYGIYVALGCVPEYF